MDTRQLEYFIAVAELLNFTKVAEKFYISQTAISLQIKSLEESLNAQLFIRNNRNVNLTPAGQAFYKEAKLILNKINEAINTTAKIASGHDGILKIGFIRGHNTHIIYDLLEKFRLQFPNVDISIMDANIGILCEHLENNSLDLIFSIDFNLEEHNNFKWISLANEPIYAVMCNNNPLSKKLKLKRSDLKNEDILFVDRSEAPSGFDGMITNCIQSGFSPKIVKQCNSLESLLLMVKLGIGITIFPKFISSNSTDNLVFIPLEGINEYVKYVLLWNINNSNPAINLFLDCISK